MLDYLRSLAGLSRGPASRSAPQSVRLKLPRKLQPINAGASVQHRSGWPYVLSLLQPLDSHRGTLLDDFVERSFAHLPKRKRPVWSEPWFGIFHHPPNFPAWFDPDAVPDTIFRQPKFVKSQRSLRGAICLSQYLADWLGTRLGVPTLALKHPSEEPPQKWSPALWEQSGRRLVQVGWYLRNYRAIYQVATPPGIQKFHLRQNDPWVLQAMQATDAHAPTRTRPDVGTTAVLEPVSNDAYDALFASSVVFLELFDTSANNAVVEAIVRNTPIIVNRHPAVVEYLGAEYPLFYDDLAEVHELLRERTVLAAHDYLRGLDKGEFAGEHFRDRLMEFIAAHY